MSKECVIDIKTGKINESSDITIYLKGTRPNEDNCYIDKLKLCVKNKDEKEKEYDLNLSGYDFRLYLIPFLTEGKDDILVCGNTDTNEKFKIINIYSFKDDKLIEFFNSERFCELYQYKTRYLKNNKLELLCKKSEKKYIVDISDKKIDYLKEIYNSEGKIICDNDPEISTIKDIELVLIKDNNLYKINTIQDITIGINRYKVAVLGNSIIFRENKIEVIDQYIKKEGSDVSPESIYYEKKDQLVKKIPNNANLINLNKFGGTNGVIKYDLDGDGIEEVICAYKKDETQYLAVFREVNNIIEMIDSVEGSGYDISDLIIKKIKAKGRNNIIIGWKIGSIWSVLDILEFKDNKISRVISSEKLNYSKMYLIDSEMRGNLLDLAIWTHETGEAYNVQIYSLRGEKLEKNQKGNRSYFEKVEQYYKELINKSRETPQYLYYLIEAQLKAGKRKEAIENLNKAMKHEKPYPSIQELKRMKKNL